MQNSGNAPSNPGGRISSALDRMRGLLGGGGGVDVPSPNIAPPPVAPVGRDVNSSAVPITAVTNRERPGVQINSLTQALALSDYVTLDLEEGEWQGENTVLYLSLVKVVGGVVADSFETAMSHGVSNADYATPSEEALRLLFGFVGDLPVLGNRYDSFERNDIDVLLGREGAPWPSAWAGLTEIARRAEGESYSPRLRDMMWDSDLKDLLRTTFYDSEVGTRPTAWMMSYLFEDLKRLRQVTTDRDMERFLESWVKFEPTPGITRAYMRDRTPSVEGRFPPAKDRLVIGTEEVNSTRSEAEAADDHRNRVIVDGLAVDYRCDQVLLVDGHTTRTRLVYDPGVRVDDSQRIVTLNSLAGLRSYVVLHYRSASADMPFDVGAVKVENGIVTKTFSSLIQSSGGPALRDTAGVSLYSLSQAPELDEVIRSMKLFAGGLPIVTMSDRWQSHREINEPFGPLLLANTWVDLAQLAGRSHRMWRNVKTREYQSLLDSHGIPHSGESDKEFATNAAWAICRLFEEIRLKEKRITPEHYSRFVASWDGMKPVIHEDHLTAAQQSQFAREWAEKAVAGAGKFSIIRKEELEAALSHAGISLDRFSNASDVLIWGGAENPERMRPEALTATVRKALTDKKAKGRVLAVFSEAEVVQALGLTKARFAPLVAAPVAARTQDPVSPPTLVTPSLSMFTASSSTPDSSTMNKPLQSAAPATKLSMFSVPPAAPPGPKPDMFSPGHGKPQKSTAEGAAKPKMPWD